MTNINVIDLLVRTDTTPNRDLKTRLSQTRAIYNTLFKAEKPMTAREIMLECGEPINTFIDDDVQLPNGEWMNVHQTAHALRRMVIAGLVRVDGRREVWFNVDDDTKKRGEINLYSLIR